MKTQDVLDIIEENLQKAQTEVERLTKSMASMPVIMRAEGAEHALIALQVQIEKTEKRKGKKKCQKLNLAVGM